MKSNKNNIAYEINNLTFHEVRKFRYQELYETDCDLRDLSPPHRQRIRKLLLDHARAFSQSYKTSKQALLLAQKFNMVRSYPIQTKLYGKFNPTDIFY